MIAAIAIGLAVALSASAYQRVAYNHVPVQLTVGQLPAGATACQPHEPLAGGTRALRIYTAPTGRPVPRVRLVLSEAGRFNGAGAPATLAAGPSIVGALPRPVLRDTSATVCFVNSGSSALGLAGAATGPADQIVVRDRHGVQSHMVGRVRIDDLLSSRQVSAWRILPDLPQRIASATGTAMAPWLTGFGLIIIVAASVLLLRLPATSPRRIEILTVAVLALGSGALWAGITPALEKTDETAHFAYVQAFSELGHPPRQLADTGLLSDEFACWYNGLGVVAYRFFTSERPTWSSAARHRLDAQCAHLSRRYDGAMYHAFQPPLYYGVASVAYRAGYDLPLPSRLMLARLVSVLIAAAFVVLCYLLVREIIPGSTWPARAAATTTALQPIVMFNLTGVNPDGLFSAAAAGVALLVVRAWRRGLSLGTALGIGAAFGVGLLSKVNFLTAVPPLLVLILALWWRAGSQRLAYALRLLLGAAVTLGLFAVYLVVNHAAWKRPFSYNPPAAGGHGGSVHRLLSYAWQFFLPRLPGMHNVTGAGYIPFWHDLVRGILTRLGWWDDYGLAPFFLPCLLVAALVLVVAAAAYLVPRARRRPWPLVTAVACGLAFLAALVFAAYKFSLGSGDQMESRHVLPALPLLSLLVGSATAAVRARWRPAATALLAGGGLAYTVAALVSTLNRFYL